MNVKRLFKCVASFTYRIHFVNCFAQSIAILATVSDSADLLCDGEIVELFPIHGDRVHLFLSSQILHFHQNAL